MSSERIEAFYRDATAADVARVMNGEKVEARFTQNNGSTRKGFIAGWKETPAQWMDSHGLFWDLCQVYDPPQYWLDKPEPGEGYRLLGKFPDEDLQPGDEVRMPNEEKWRLSDLATVGGTQHKGAWYRRRIEQPKPEPKFAVGQRVKIVGPVCVGGPIYNWTREMNEHVGVVGAVRLKPTQDPEGTFYAVGEIVGWSFREDYLEAVAEPEPKHYTLHVGDTFSIPSGRQAIVTEHGIEVQ